MGGVSSPSYVLLPPSEAKEPGGRPGAEPGLFDDSLAEPRAQVLVALSSLVRGASSLEVGRIMKARGALLERALDSTRRLADGSAALLPAWQRYSGVVWSHLDATTLDDETRRRVLVPSGIYGLSCATDAIADYRLSMNVGMAGVGNVATFWRPCVTGVLEAMSNATFVSLLPKEHAAAIAQSTKLEDRLVTVSFLRHGGAGVAGHDAKAVKGVVARRVLLHGVDSVDGFRWKGWRGRLHHDAYEVRAPRIAPRP